MTVIAAMTSITLAVAPSGEMPAGFELVQAKIVDCGDAAEDILAKNDARLLSIRPHGDRCTIVVLVKKEGERPRKLIFLVPQPASADAK